MRLGFPQFSLLSQFSSIELNSIQFIHTFIIYLYHRAELCDTSGILTGAMALNLKDRGDKGQDTTNKNGRIGRGPPAFYSVTA